MNFDDLRAKRLKEKDISDGLITLKMNTPKLIDCKNNADIAVIHEQKPAEDVDEYCYIHSVFYDEATAMICNEFRLDFLKKSGRTGLTSLIFTIFVDVIDSNYEKDHHQGCRPRGRRICYAGIFRHERQGRRGRQAGLPRQS